MNRTINSRLEKIEQAIKPRYPEMPEPLSPEIVASLKEIARRLRERILGGGSEGGCREHTPEESQAVINEIVEQMKADGYLNPFSEEDSP